jgi:4-carboxymuconolactone decarboxylase
MAIPSHSANRRFGSDYNLWKGRHPMADEAATPILDLLATMTEAAVEASELDPAAQILLRFAALVALDAAPASYLFHFGAGAEQGLTLEDAQQVLVTLAPLVGTARIVSASSKISRALGFALAVSELADEELAEEDADSL